ncbi:E2 protein [Phocoena phocoena papillomavirus 1]|uniref:Regulatory protein E2 n=1 Tax=Phocoena phocoena papillomavirus 1 TaxID=706525 RepID=F2VIQ8_PSPV|nr:E2 protein [Phocoena phocoena papillomavirus 1]ADJ96343.1 E2 protein [Phocoena phocoena papillomavirus 1]
METLERFCNLLDVLQEGQMDCLEQDDGDINNVEKYLSFVRKEAMLLCAAHAKGIKRLGMTPVPPKAVCEGNAKDAIELHLLATSLKNSCYASERWTLTDVSKEMYASPPCWTFKKGGRTVRVTFGEGSGNCMDYVCWTHVYHQSEDGVWGCTSSHVDCHGIYACMDGFKNYYIDFTKEAVKYGASPDCKIVWEGSGLTPSALVSSTSSCDLTSVSTTGGDSEDSTEDFRRPPKKRARSYVCRDPLTDTDSGPEPDSPAPSAHPVHSTPLTHEQRERSDGTDIPTTGVCEPDRGSSRGSGDYPLIPALLISGGGNQVKCLRWRLKRHHKRDYRNCSTTWTWVSNVDGLSREPGHRIFVSFYSEQQRQTFLDRTPLPQGVKTAFCELPF